jgi:hypothetical protein
MSKIRSGAQEFLDFAQYRSVPHGAEPKSPLLAKDARNETPWKGKFKHHPERKVEG